jgi:hypothetical protein
MRFYTFWKESVRKRKAKSHIKTGSVNAALKRFNVVYFAVLKKNSKNYLRQVFNFRLARFATKQGRSRHNISAASRVDKSAYVWAQVRNGNKLICGRELKEVVKTKFSTLS